MQNVMSISDVSKRMEQKLKDQIDQNSVVLYGRQRCMQTLDLASRLIHMKKEKILILKIDENGKEEEIVYMKLFEKLYGITEFPIVFIDKKYIGGKDQILPMLDGKLGTFEKELKNDFMFELCIIGGGTCGSKAAIDASKDMLVALIDSNVDTMKENVTGLGDASKLTTELLPKYFIHKKLFILKRIQKINTNTIWHEVMLPLRKKMAEVMVRRMKEVKENSNIRYYPGRGVLLDSHTVRVTKSEKVSNIITARKIIIAAGTKLSESNIEGAHLGITTDQLFHMQDKPSGKLLIVGDALKCLEVGGMLGKMGLFCIVMTSGTCRVFDQDLMNQVIQTSKVLGVKFLLDYRVTKLVEENGRIVVHGVNNLGNIFEEHYNMVLFTNNRQGRTNNLGLDKVGLKVNKNNGKIIVNNNGTTANPSVFVTGSVMDGPSACTDNVTYEQHTINLIRGFRTNSITELNSEMFPRIALTPREYGAIGDTEGTAIAKYGKESVRIYQASRGELFVKLVCMKQMEDRIIGIHILSPRAPDILQPYVTCMIIGISKNDVDILQFTEKNKNKQDLKTDTK